jgi:hypothetical protein
VKDDVDRALAPFGFAVPEWHTVMKNDIEPLTATVDGLLRVARAAGVDDADVVVHHVDSGLRTPDDLVALRFGMATVAPFLARLDAPTREQARAASVAALGDDPPPFVVDLLVLVARAS